MADRKVTVRVDVNAAGNLGQVLTGQAAAATALAGKGGGVQSPAQAAAALAASHQRLEKISGGLIGAFATMGVTLGAVAAAGGGAFETFTNSVKLAAGEMGIALIPSIVAISGWFQSLAQKIRFINDVTGGWAGKIIGGALVMGLMFAATVKATIALERLAGAAFGGSVGAGAAGVAGAGGIGATRAGRFGIGMAAAAGAQMAGSAIGGTAGDLIGAAGSGAAIGFMVGGPIGAAIGAGAGLLVAGLSHAFEDGAKKMSLSFTGGQVPFENMWDQIQNAAVRDPMAQARFEQEMRAMETLINEVRVLNRAPTGVQILAP